MEDSELHISYRGLLDDDKAGHESQTEGRTRNMQVQRRFSFGSEAGLTLRMNLAAPLRRKLHRRKSLDCNWRTATTEIARENYHSEKPSSETMMSFGGAKQLTFSTSLPEKSSMKTEKENDQESMQPGSQNLMETKMSLPVELIAESSLSENKTVPFLQLSMSPEPCTQRKKNFNDSSSPASEPSRRSIDMVGNREKDVEEQYQISPKKNGDAGISKQDNNSNSEKRTRNRSRDRRLHALRESDQTTRKKNSTASTQRAMKGVKNSDRITRIKEIGRQRSKSNDKLLAMMKATIPTSERKSPTLTRRRVRNSEYLNSTKGESRDNDMLQDIASSRRGRSRNGRRIVKSLNTGQARRFRSSEKMKGKEETTTTKDMQVIDKEIKGKEPVSPPKQNFSSLRSQRGNLRRTNSSIQRTEAEGVFYSAMKGKDRH